MDVLLTQSPITQRLSPQYLVVAVPPHSRRQSLHAEPDHDCADGGAGGTAPGDAVLRQRGDGGRLAAGGARPSGLCGHRAIPDTAARVAAGHILSQLPATLLIPEKQETAAGRRSSRRQVGQELWSS